jgi:hypothetical protein
VNVVVTAPAQVSAQLTAAGGIEVLTVSALGRQAPEPKDDHQESVPEFCAETSMRAMMKLIMGTPEPGTENDPTRVNTGVLLLQAKSMFRAPPSPAQAFQARLSPTPANATDAPRESETAAARIEAMRCDMGDLTTRAPGDARGRERT